MKRKNKYVFGGTADVFRRRNLFSLSHGVKTALNAGDLVPLPPIFIYPGDTIKDFTGIVARVTSSFLKPVMDNAFMDIRFFFVPYRLVWKDWEKFITGGSGPSSYDSPYDGVVPYIKGTSGSSFTIPNSTVLDYLGIPADMPIPYENKVSILAARAYGLIYNHWYRNESLIDEVLVQTGDFAQSEMPNSNPAGPNNYTGQCFKVSKLDDYFTSCLPQPQKGPSVSLPVSAYSDVPVTTGPSVYVDNSRIPLLFQKTNGSAFSAGSRQGLTVYNGADVDSLSSRLVAGDGAGSVVPPGSDILPVNMVAKTSQLDATATSVSDLRFAFQLQRLYERLARQGSRYNEYNLSTFGVRTSDARLQLPEFVGGKRIPLNVQQVAQTSSPTSSSPLGGLGAFSQTSSQCRFHQGFTEHGMILPVVCIRHYHTYQQGIRRDFLLSQRTHFYDPVFSHLSEQPVYQTEIFASAPRSNSFGFNESYAFIRSIPSQVTGQMRSSAENTLDIWHFADDYSNAPVLGQEWIEETERYIDRTLSVPASSLKQFIVEVYHHIDAYRVAPLYGTPGLIDHQ